MLPGDLTSGSTTAGNDGAIPPKSWRLGGSTGGYLPPPWIREGAQVRSKFRARSGT